MVRYKERAKRRSLVGRGRGDAGGGGGGGGGGDGSLPVRRPRKKRRMRPGKLASYIVFHCSIVIVSFAQTLTLLIATLFSTACIYQVKGP